MDLDLVIVIAALLIGAAAWITGVHMRRRARKALWGKISDSELTCINTWMDVEEAEKRKPLG